MRSEGEDAEHRAVAFASFIGGQVANDHYPLYEVYLRRGPPAVLLSSARYSGDIAGLEGLSAAVVTLTLSLAGLALAPGLLLFAALVRAFRRSVRGAPRQA